jgi:hypothetical protein
MVSKKSVDAAPVEAAEGLFGPFIRSAGLPLRRQRGRPRKAPATTVGLPHTLSETMICGGIVAYSAAKHHKLASRAAVELIYEAFRCSASRMTAEDEKRARRFPHADHQLWSMPAITTPMILEGSRTYRRTVRDKIPRERAIRLIYDGIYKVALA